MHTTLLRSGAGRSRVAMVELDDESAPVVPPIFVKVKTDSSSMSCRAASTSSKYSFSASTLARVLECFSSKTEPSLMFLSCHATAIYDASAVHMNPRRPRGHATQASGR